MKKIKPVKGWGWVSKYGTILMASAIVDKKTADIIASEQGAFNGCMVERCEIRVVERKKK